MITIPLKLKTKRLCPSTTFVHPFSFLHSRLDSPVKPFCFISKDPLTVEWQPRPYWKNTPGGELQRQCFASLLYSSSVWARQRCLSAHHPHLMFLDLLFIQLCRSDMWDTSPINNWVMRCSPLSTGRGCSGEIKGVLWRLRHRSGTSSPWGLWKQKRGIMGKWEIGGRKKKINKICLAGSDEEWKRCVKQEMGHGNQVVNRTLSVFD